MSFKVFKVIKVGTMEREVKLLPYDFNKLSMAKVHASLEYSSNMDSCSDIIVKGEDGEILFRANGNSGGVSQSQIDKMKEIRKRLGG